MIFRPSFFCIGPCEDSLQSSKSFSTPRLSPELSTLSFPGCTFSRRVLLTHRKQKAAVGTRLALEKAIWGGFPLDCLRSARRHRHSGSCHADQCDCGVASTPLVASVGGSLLSGLRHLCQPDFCPNPGRRKSREDQRDRIPVWAEIFVPGSQSSRRCDHRSQRRAN